MGTSPQFAVLAQAVPLVEPSLLNCDFRKLGEEIRQLEEAGAKVLHLDIMDGHFVPNLSFGIPIVQAVRRATRLPLDVHLMIANPQRYLRAYREAGADVLTVHIEVAPDPRPLLDEIHEVGAAAGLSLNPPTATASLEPFLGQCDVVLVMSVMPGFGGQSFQSVALDKLRHLRAVAPPEMLLAVDGGVNPETIGPCAQAGADLLVVGTALLGHADYVGRLAELSSLARSWKHVQV